MRNTLTNVVAFAAGAAIGSAVTWKLLKVKYEQIAQEEIGSVKEVFANRQSEPDEDDTERRFEIAPPVKEDHDVEQLDIGDYAEKLQEMAYVNYGSQAVHNTHKKKKHKRTDPYVISPEEFAEIGYRTITLIYYADKILADEEGNIIGDVDDTVGLSSLDTFGKFEQDSVYVRDDRRKIDYEILADEGEYPDAFKSNPHQAEDEWDGES